MAEFRYSEELRALAKETVKAFLVAQRAALEAGDHKMIGRLANTGISAANHILMSQHEDHNERMSLWSAFSEEDVVDL